MKRLNQMVLKVKFTHLRIIQKNEHMRQNDKIKSERIVTEEEYSECCGPFITLH